jgi:hypothetical protein
MFQDRAGSTAVTVPPLTFTSASRVGVTRSGLPPAVAPRIYVVDDLTVD